MFVTHTPHEPGRDNADGVMPDYLVCDYLGFHPDGGLPYGHLEKSTVHNGYIVLLGVSTVLRPLALPLGDVPACNSNKSNRRHKGFAFLSL